MPIVNVSVGCNDDAWREVISGRSVKNGVFFLQIERGISSQRLLRLRNYQSGGILF
jgi:hypothetical protein